jgi:hypothetical protein
VVVYLDLKMEKGKLNNLEVQKFTIQFINQLFNGNFDFEITELEKIFIFSKYLLEQESLNEVPSKDCLKVEINQTMESFHVDISLRNFYRSPKGGTRSQRILEYDKFLSYFETQKLEILKKRFVNFIETPLLSD